jgi:hypothetical protein
MPRGVRASRRPACYSRRVFSRVQFLGAALLAAAIAGGLAYHALVSPESAFLVRREAPWIVAQTPLQTDGIAIDLAHPPTAFFARPFAGDAGNGPVVLHVRALREVELFLNQRALPLAPADAASWRRARTLDLRPHLAPGENVVAARVRNPIGTPALQLWIEGLPERIETDARWVGAWEGDPPAYAVLAEDSVRHPEAAALALPWPSLARHAPLVALFAAAGGALFLALRRLPEEAARRAPAAALAVLAIFYALLLRHALQFPAGVGFDAHAHLAYVDWIAAHRALPHPREGSIMYHPPLYHAASALLLGALRGTGVSAHAVLLFLPLACGFGMAWIASATLRALAPGASWLAAGAALAAGLLPMNLVIASSPSNEGPSAFLASLALLVAVRALVRERASHRDDAWLGVVLGAAAATKYSGLLWIPVTIGSIFAKRVLVERSGLVRAALGAALAAGLAAALAGWVYARNFALAGDPLVWNLNVEAGRTWFQLPGFHTVDYYVRFGDALAAPWFASFHSFWDSLYTTLWGDGLLSGAASPRAATVRWNVEAMAAGFALAAPATVLLAVGWFASLRDALRGADLGRRLAASLLVALPPVFLALLASLSLRYPFWSAAKSFYALALTPTLAVLGALGFGALDAALARRAPLAVRALPYGLAGALFAAIAWSFVG